MTVDAVTNFDAVNVTVRAMRATGCLEDVDAAVVALARASARSLDAAEPGSSASAQCARAHAVVLEHLRSLSKHDDDTIPRLLDRLGDTPMGDAPVT